MFVFDFHVQRGNHGPLCGPTPANDYAISIVNDQIPVYLSTLRHKITYYPILLFQRLPVCFMVYEAHGLYAPGKIPGAVRKSRLPAGILMGKGAQIQRSRTGDPAVPAY